ncbi:hypothetical protein [Polaribacter atrinae]|uniref:hypothetical protein n=1 Tax=Polaribacter atrinae TaxID=1333662 RepID=UPI0030FA6656
MKPIYKIILLLLLFPLVTHANTDRKKHEKNKIITKVFNVNKDAKVALNNKYGSLNITTWDKNKVEIKVTITIQGDDLDDVEERLSTIDVLFNANASLVEAKTMIENQNSAWSWWGKSKKINYKINYVVKMPRSNSVNLHNIYGDIYLDNLDGSAAISCDYGKVSIVRLSGIKNTVNLEYCTTSSINYIKEGVIKSDYSKLNIRTSENLKINANYSTIKLDNTKNIDFNCDYGSIYIEEAEEIIGSSDYVSMHFGTVKKNLNIETDYGSLTVQNLVKDFKNVTINGEYAGIRIHIDSDTVFEFMIDLEYASFSGDDDKMELFKSISKSTKKYYEGKFGKGNTNSKLKITSQYGGVSIK